MAWSTTLSRVVQFNGTSWHALRAVHVGTTAPSNPQTGDVWIDEASTPGGGGGGSPGGADTQIQFNDATAFGGDADLTWNKTTNTLGLNGADTGINFKGITNEPAVPATDTLRMYTKKIAGRLLPKIIGPSGIDTVLQVGLSGNAVFMVAPANGTTAPTAWGGVLNTAVGTVSHQQTIASANPWLATRRTRYASAATAAASAGVRTAYGQWFRGNAAGFGGFWFRVQVGQALNVNGAQQFFGLCGSTAALATTAGAVSALINSLGMGYDTTDASTGNWFFYRNDGTTTATKVNLGADAVRNTTHGYDLIMYSPPNGTDVFVRITNLHTNVVVLDTSYNTDLPAVNVGLALKCEGNNGAVASAISLEFAKIYIESDY